MIWLRLFLCFAQVGMFSVGGGYVAIPLIQNQVVALNGWLSMAEFTDLVTIAEMTPGPIVINAATFVGIRIAGIPGALAATFGSILPSCVVVSLLSYVYARYKSMRALQSVLSGLRPVVVALIASAGLSILNLVVFAARRPGWDSVQWLGAALFIAAFFALRRFRWNPILVMSLCGAAALALYAAFGIGA